MTKIEQFKKIVDTKSLGKVEGQVSDLANKG